MIGAEQFLTEMDGRLFITFPYILLGILLFFTRPSPLHSYIPRVNSITQKHQDFMDTFHALGMNHITNGYCLITEVTAFSRIIFQLIGTKQLQTETKLLWAADIKSHISFHMATLNLTVADI